MSLFGFLLRLLYVLLFLVILFACAWLSFWQYSKAKITDDLLANLNSVANQNESPLLFEGSFKSDRLFFLDGKFLENTSFLINARFFKKQLGYDVVTLFEAQDGKRYWVNRGWVKRLGDRRFEPWEDVFLSQRLLFYVKAHSSQGDLPKFEYFEGYRVLPYLDLLWLNVLSGKRGQSNFFLLPLAAQQNILGVDLSSQMAYLIKKRSKHYMYFGQWIAIGLVWCVMCFIFRRRYA